MKKKPLEGKLGAGKSGGSRGKEEMISHMKKMYQRKKKGRGEPMTQETHGKQARRHRSLLRRGRWRRSEKGMVSRMAQRTRGPSRQGCRLGGAPWAPREPAAVLGAGAGGSGHASGHWRQASRRGGGPPAYTIGGPRLEPRHWQVLKRPHPLCRRDTGVSRVERATCF